MSDTPSKLLLRSILLDGGGVKLGNGERSTEGRTGRYTKPRVDILTAGSYWYPAAFRRAAPPAIRRSMAESSAKR